MISRLPFVLLLSMLFVPYVQAQPAPKGIPPAPVRLTTIDVPKALTAGTVGHFRAQIAPKPARPVNYLWDLGDGTVSIGALVSHAYATAGTYDLTVVARNPDGADTLQASITVDVPLSDSAPTMPEVRGSGAADAPPGQPKKTSRPFRVPVSRAAVFGAGGITPEEGRYTWVLSSDLWKDRAHDRMLVYRLHGFRADIYVDTSGSGSPAYRIVIGQFHTPAEAQVARRWLPSGGVSPWLLELELAGATGLPVRDG